jgi:hypothetical protein
MTYQVEKSVSKLCFQMGQLVCRYAEDRVGMNKNLKDAVEEFYQLLTTAGPELC